MPSLTRLAAMPSRSLCRIALALLALFALAPVGGTFAQGTGGSISVTFGPSEVWDAGPQAEQLHACGQPTVTCVTQVMQASGASTGAIGFYRLTGWFLSDLQGGDPVQLGTVFSPWRANENFQAVLLGGSPSIVMPEVEVAALSTGSWSGDPMYAMLKSSYPNVMFWGGSPNLDTVDVSPSGGQRFVFDYRMLDGCHACATVALARVAFDFAPDGTYQSLQPLDLVASS